MIVLLPAPAVKIDDILVKVNNSHRAASVLAPDSSPIHLRFFLKWAKPGLCSQRVNSINTPSTDKWPLHAAKQIRIWFKIIFFS